MPEQLETLTEARRLAAITAILEACTTTPQEMNARLYKELRRLPEVQPLSDSALSRLLAALTVAGLLWRPPQFPTRTARYVTTWLGLQALTLYRAAASSEKPSS